MRIGICLFCFIIFLFSNLAFADAQNHFIHGRIIDKMTNEGLIGATVVVNTNNGTITDFDGNFTIKTNKLPITLTISYIGYVTQNIKVTSSKEPLTILLAEENVTLDEIVIKSKKRRTKDEFAWYIHSKIVENAEKNNPDNISPLNYNDFQRISVFYKKNNKQAKRDSTLEQYINVPFMINEELFNINRKAKGDEEKQSLYSDNKVILEEMAHHIDVVLKQYITTDINFYENQLYLLGRALPSPISSNASLYYRMYLTDSTTIDHRKMYKFRFFSKNKHSTTFVGNFSVDSTTWAITDISAQLPNTGNINFISDLKVSTSYQLTEDGKKWFKDKQTTEMDYSLAGSEDNTNVMLNFLNFNVKRTHLYSFTTKEDVIDHLNSTTNNIANYVERYKTPLDSIELQAESEINRIKENTSSKLLDKTIKMLVSTYLNIGKIDIGPYATMYRNTLVEGHRFSLPLRTSEKLFKNFTIGGYLSYSTALHEFGHGANFHLRIPTKNRFIISANTDENYFNLSTNKFNEFIQENPFNTGTDDFVSSIITFERNAYMVKKAQNSITIKYKPSTNIDLFIRPSYEKYIANETNHHYTPYILFKQQGKIHNYFETQTLLLDLRYAKEQIYDDFFMDRVYYDNERPIYHVSLLTGRYNLPNNSNGHYFANINLTMKWYKNIGPMQLTSLIETGGILGDVPYPLLDLPKGSGDIGLARYHYNLLNHTSIVSDAYLHLHTTLNLGGTIVGKIPLIKKLNLREVIGFKAYHGALLGEHNRVFELPDFLHEPSSTPYMEYSVGVTNIFKVLRVEYVGSLSPHAVDKGYAKKDGVHIRFEMSF